MSATDCASAAKLLTPHVVAALLGIKRQSLRLRRMRGLGPPFIRLGDSPTSRVMYREADVLGWLAERPTFTGTMQEKAARIKVTSAA